MSLGKVTISLPAFRIPGEERWALQIAKLLVRGVGGKPRGFLARWFAPRGIYVDIDSSKEEIRVVVGLYAGERRIIATTSKYMSLEVQNDEVLFPLIYALNFISHTWLGGILYVSESKGDEFCCSWESLREWGFKKGQTGIFV